MNGLLGMVSLLGASELDAEQREYVEMATQSGEALLTLVNDILDFSKVEAGRLRFEMLPFDLGSTVEDAIELLRPTAEAKGLDLLLYCEPAVPPVLLGDGGRVRQAVLNLVSNALKFTQSGHVRVCVKCTERDADVEVEISVEDTGPGVPVDEIPLLFEKYGQGGDATARRFGGTGLGLAITKAIAEGMGGGVGVRSTVGEGSTFWFTMHLGRAKAAPLPRAAATALSSKRQVDRGRVLVVEDNLVNQHVAQRMLEVLGCRVDVAANGLEAVGLVLKVRYDLILMDCQMPSMDGFTASRLIRESRPDLPIVALTANGMKQDEERCLAAGMNAYLCKPVGPQELDSVLRRYIEDRNKTRPRIDRSSDSISSDA